MSPERPEATSDHQSDPRTDLGAGGRATIDVARDGDIESLLAQLTRTERCSLVHGRTAWIVPGIERLGIPEWAVSDGPIGVRGRKVVPALCLPSASAWAATFDIDLVDELGRAIATEARDRRVTMVLGPTVNLHRHPLGGRHFECYSEDPHLTAATAVAYIRGVQEERVGACIKHFVANEQEEHRRSISSEVDERALRELYLLPFEAAVRDAGVWGVMAAYNDIGGIQACDHTELLRGVLKGEWGFAGLVVSDWGAMKSTVGPALGGLDLEMPGPGRYWGGGRLEAAVDAGEVPEDDVTDKARRILRFLQWSGLLGTDGPGHEEASVDRPEHRELARRAAADGMVLLKNEGALLPLDPGTLTRVAVLGPNAAHTSLFGGGSAALAPHRTTTVLAALEERLDECDVVHASGCSIRLDPGDFLAHHLPDGVTVELYDALRPEGRPFAVDEGRGAFNLWMDHSWPEGIETLSVRARATFVPDESGRWRIGAGAFGLVRVFLDGELIADSEVEHFSSAVALRTTAAMVELEQSRRYELVVETRPVAPGWKFLLTRFGGRHDPPRPERIDEAVAAAADADVAIVVVGTSLEYESEDDDRRTLSLPGDQDELVRRVAAANPRTVVVCNTGSPVTMPWADDVPSIVQAWFPGQEGGAAVADVLLGDAEPAGRLPTTWPRRIEDTPAFLDWPGEAGRVRYGESVFVGYRWYDARDIEPQWCFGHGLGYGAFDWGSPRLSTTRFGATDAEVEVRVVQPVTNIGDRVASEVVQCYVAPLDPQVRRPVQELRGFAKVRPAPGTTAEACIDLDRRAFSRWDPNRHEWVVDPGRYEIRLARSARDPVVTAIVEITEE